MTSRPIAEYRFDGARVTFDELERLAFTVLSRVVVIEKLPMRSGHTIWQRCSICLYRFGVELSDTAIEDARNLGALVFDVIDRSYRAHVCDVRSLSPELLHAMYERAENEGTRLLELSHRLKQLAVYKDALRNAGN